MLSSVKLHRIALLLAVGRCRVSCQLEMDWPSKLVIQCPESEFKTCL